MVLGELPRPEVIKKLWKLYNIDYTTTVIFNSHIESITKTKQPHSDNPWLIDLMLKDGHICAIDGGYKCVWGR